MTVPRTAPGLNAIAGPAAHTCDANDAGPGATWSEVSHGLQLQPLWRTLLQLSDPWLAAATPVENPTAANRIDPDRRSHDQLPVGRGLLRRAGDAPSPSLLKYLLTGEAGAAE